MVLPAEDGHDAGVEYVSSGSGGFVEYVGPCGGTNSFRCLLFLMPTTTDRGMADLKIYGRGLSICLDVKPRGPSPSEETPAAHALG